MTYTPMGQVVNPEISAELMQISQVISELQNRTAFLLDEASISDWVMTFNSSTSDVDPTSGFMSFDSLTPASVTVLRLDDLRRDGSDHHYLLSNIEVDDFIWMKGESAADYMLVKVSAAPTDQTGWWKMAVTPVAYGTMFSNGDKVVCSLQKYTDKTYSTVKEITDDYTLVLADKGTTIRRTGSTVGVEITIPANSSVAYKTGTLIAMHNDGTNDMTVAITTDTMTWANDNTTGTRTIAAGGMAVIQKTATTNWKFAGKQTT